MRKIAVLAFSLLLAGCASDEARQEPIVTTQIVDVAVPVHCKPDIGPDPVYPDTAAAFKAAPDIFERVKLLVVGRLMRIQREGELEAAVHGCE